MDTEDAKKSTVSHTVLTWSKKYLHNTKREDHTEKRLVTSRQSVKEWARTRSSKQVMSPRRAIPNEDKESYIGKGDEE